MQFEWSAIWDAFPILLEGAKLTLWISIVGLLGGLVIGLVAGFARAYGGWLSNHIALVFIELIRGTPIVVQVMFIPADDATSIHASAYRSAHRGGRDDHD